MTINDILEGIERPSRSGIEGSLLAIMLLFEVLMMSGSGWVIFPRQIVTSKLRLSDYRSQPLVFMGAGRLPSTSTGASGEGQEVFPHCDEKLIAWDGRSEIFHYPTLGNCQLTNSSGKIVDPPDSGQWVDVDIFGDVKRQIRKDPKPFDRQYPGRYFEADEISRMERGEIQ